MKYRNYLLLMILIPHTIKSTSLNICEYTSNYENYSQYINKETAVLIVAYNRPDYFKQCIKSIEKNPEHEILPFFFALDGGPNSSQMENIEIIKKSKIKNKYMLIAPRNYGCPKNHINAKKFLFDWCQFKRIIVLEDDVIISPSYFKFILNFYNWATSRFSNIGAVQGWSYCYLSNQEKRKKLAFVKENDKTFSFLTYCLDINAWNKIKSILYMFESFVDQIPLSDEYTKERSKPCFWEGMPQIRTWVQNLINQKISKEEIDHRILKSKFTEKFRKIFSSPSFLAAQDVMMGFSFFMNDLIKLTPIVNRATHIGKHGITLTENSFYAFGFHKIKLDNFDEDNILTTFQLI